MKNSFFGGLKDRILRAADVDEENENMYDESDEYDEYEDDEDYEDEGEQRYDSNMNYNFGYASSGYSSKSNQSHSSFGASEQSGDSKDSYNEKFTRKANSNIYQMNNTPVSKVNRVVYFLLEDTADARNIADCMKAEDAIVLAELSKLSDVDSQCVLNFIDGVRYVFDSHIEMIGHDVYLIVPKSIELAGDFYEQMPGVFF